METNGKIISWDERRDITVQADPKEAISFAAEHWIHTCRRAIHQKGRFAVALSGGSTPKAIYAALTQSDQIDWENVWLFWSDERAVPPNHTDSNYHMAMEAGLKNMPIPPNQILRMTAEKEIEKNAADYEEKIRRILGKQLFDLVMLGVGEDGHTASLFPDTPALAESKKLVLPNFAGEKKGMRMTFSFSCINQSSKIAIYAIGPSKKEILPKVLNAPIESPWPSSKIGTVDHKSLWITDQEAAFNLKK